MEKIRALQARLKARSETINHAHHYCEFAYCVAALADMHALHTVTVGGLALVVFVAIWAGE